MFTQGSSRVSQLYERDRPISEGRYMEHGSVLASWREGGTRDAIVEFVERVTEGGPDSIPEAERIAVFDNDGTLWTEKPLPTQLHFIVLQWVAAVRDDSALAETQPYKAAAAGDFAWLGAAVDKHYAGDDTDLKLLTDAILTSTDGHVGRRVRGKRRRVLS